MSDTNKIRKLAKMKKETYDDIVTPDMDTLYFTTDTDEIFLGTHKLGSGFVWTDANNPRPKVGVSGVFYIDRDTLDLHIWNEQLYRWVYFGNAGENNSLSVSKFYEFRQDIIDMVEKNNKRVDDIIKNHYYTESRLYFVTDSFKKIPENDYWVIRIPKTEKERNLLVKNVYAHLEGTPTYQIVYPDITETQEEIVLQFTTPVAGFCILS